MSQFLFRPLTMQLSVVLLIFFHLKLIATEVIHSKIGLQAAVQLMSNLPDGNFTNLFIVQESKNESDEDIFDEVTILTDNIYDVMTAKKIFLRYFYLLTASPCIVRKNV